MRDPEKLEMYWQFVKTVKKLAGIKNLTRLVDFYREEKAIQSVY